MKLWTLAIPAVLLVGCGDDDAELTSSQRVVAGAWSRLTPSAQAEMCGRVKDGEENEVADEVQAVLNDPDDELHDFVVAYLLLSCG